MDNTTWRVGAVLVAAVLAASVAAWSIGGDVAQLRLAGLEDLARYPRAVPAGERAADEALAAVIIPGTDLVVILRPLTESEYASFQVQAIGHRIIEQQVLAASIVLPIVTESDIEALSEELVAFLQRQVNAASGFDVFTSIP